MTENKRFYVDKSGDFRDKQTGNIIVDFGYNFNAMECRMILDLLNELNTDNETLQQRNNEFGEKIKQLQKENITIKNTIRDAMENERTHIGYNVLKQLMEQIE